MEEQLMDGMMHFVSIFIMRNVPLSSLSLYIEIFSELEE